MENKLDIVQLIINNIPTDTETQNRIKMYMQVHKTNCNNFIYTNYSKEAIFFNSLLKAMMQDLSAEIIRVLVQKEITEKKGR